MMAWRMASSATYHFLLLLALTHQLVVAARPHRSTLDLDHRRTLDLDEERTLLAKLRFEAGDPACGRFQFRYACFDDDQASSDTQALFPNDDAQDLSDCGPLGKHKYRCGPLLETPAVKIPLKTPAPEEVAAIAQGEARTLPEDDLSLHPSDCGPIGVHKYRCVPPLKTQSPEEFFPDVVPSAPEDSGVPVRSVCGPLSLHKFRCVPP